MSSNHNRAARDQENDQGQTNGIRNSYKRKTEDDDSENEFESNSDSRRLKKSIYITNEIKILDTFDDLKELQAFKVQDHQLKHNEGYNVKKFLTEKIKNGLSYQLIAGGWAYEKAANWANEPFNEVIDKLINMQRKDTHGDDIYSQFRELDLEYKHPLDRNAFARYNDRMSTILLQHSQDEGNEDEHGEPTFEYKKLIKSQLDKWKTSKSLTLRQLYHMVNSNEDNFESIDDFRTHAAIEVYELHSAAALMQKCGVLNESNLEDEVKTKPSSSSDLKMGGGDSTSPTYHNSTIKCTRCGRPGHLKVACRFDGDVDANEDDIPWHKSTKGKFFAKFNWNCLPPSAARENGQVKPQQKNNNKIDKSK